MRPEDREALRVDLVHDEGDIPYAYQDHLGYWTIGTGHLIDRRKGGGLPDVIRAALLQHDMTAVLADLQSFAWFGRLDPVRQRALCNMRFQLGPAGFRGFRRMMAALDRGDFGAAAREARDSKWAREDTPERARRVTRQLETGEA